MSTGCRALLEIGVCVVYAINYNRIRHNINDSHPDYKELLYRFITYAIV